MRYRRVTKEQLRRERLARRQSYAESAQPQPAPGIIWVDVKPTEPIWTYVSYERPYNCICPTPEQIAQNPGATWGIACPAHVTC